MYNTILVPLDGSERAENILPHVENLASHENAHVILASIIEPVNRNTVFDVSTRDEVLFKPQLVADTKKYLNKVKTRFDEKKISAEMMVLQGVAVDGILHATKVKEVNLIAMTSKGRTGLSQVVYGSVAAGVLHRVNCPLLVTYRDNPPPTNIAAGRILVPLDGSKRAETVLPHVEGIAQLYGAKVTLLQVLSTSYKDTVFENIDAEITEKEYHDHLLKKMQHHQEFQRVEKARNYLISVRDGLRAKGVDVEAHLVHDRPVGGIVHAAKEIDASLIVMTSHGKSGLGQLFYGSIAAGVLNQGKRPLLIMRPNPTKKPTKNFV